MALLVPKIWRFHIIPGRLLETFETRKSLNANQDLEPIYPQRELNTFILAIGTQPLPSKITPAGPTLSGHISMSVARYTTPSPPQSSSVSISKVKTQAPSPILPIPFHQQQRSNLRAFSFFPISMAQATSSTRYPIRKVQMTLAYLGKELFHFGLRSASSCTRDFFLLEPNRPVSSHASSPSLSSSDRYHPLTFQYFVQCLGIASSPDFTTLN